MIEFCRENVLNISCYLVFACTFLSFWVCENKKISVGIFLVAVVIALFSKNIDLISLPTIALLGFTIYLFYKKNLGKLSKIFLFVAISVITILLFLHKLPGFNNWQVFEKIQLSGTSAPFSFWLNFDKPLIAFFLLLFAYKPISRLDQCKIIVQNLVPVFVVLIAMLSLFATLLGYVLFEPKIPDSLITSLWLIKMLFFTALVEEMFFRFFIQNNCIKIFEKFKYRNVIGLILSSALFAAFHFGGGLSFVILAFFSGLVYGGIYLKTKYIESAILLHLLINMVHFFFFSYPSISNLKFFPN